MTYAELCDLYVALLNHPHDKWRAENQHVYCIVRDEIAKKTRTPAEEVQNGFEEHAQRVREWAQTEVVSYRRSA